MKPKLKINFSFKLNSKNLLTLILVQIILINILVVAFLVKHIITKPKDDEKIQVTHNAKNDNGKKSGAADSERYKKSVMFDERAKNDIMKQVTHILGLYKQKEKDFKMKESLYESNAFTATAYDLSYESCGKYPDNPAYGVTYSGSRAVKGRTVAVDPGVIPIGSDVYIEFPSQYSYMDGWYIAEDTGRKVKGKVIDIFMGEAASHDMEKFGRRTVNVKVLYSDSDKKLLKNKTS